MSSTCCMRVREQLAEVGSMTHHRRTFRTTCLPSNHEHPCFLEELSCEDRTCVGVNQTDQTETVAKVSQAGTLNGCLG